MSTRRFVAYFLAISAGSTVAFASKLVGSPKPPAITAEQAADLSYLEAPSPLLQTMRAKRHPKAAASVAQVALLK